MSKQMAEITQCVVCGKRLQANRIHVDTCGERCFKHLLRRQRASFEEAACSEVDCASAREEFPENVPET